MTARNIPVILDRQECKKHRAPLGTPCFLVYSTATDTHLAGVCNKRAKLAGFVGKISDQALRKTSSR